MRQVSFKNAAKIKVLMTTHGLFIQYVHAPCSKMENVEPSSLISDRNGLSPYQVPRKTRLFNYCFLSTHMKFLKWNTPITIFVFMYCGKRFRFVFFSLGV